MTEPFEDLDGGLRGGRVHAREGVGPQDDRCAVGGGGGEAAVAQPRQRAARIDAEDPRHARRAQQECRDPARGEAQEQRQPAEHVVDARARAALVVFVEELGLVGGHVDADGAFTRARLAGQTQVERVADFRGAETLEGLAAHRLRQQAGAAAGGVHLIARDLE